MEAGKPYQFTIDLWATSNVFLPGHRIRLEISSSNFPRFDRNLNTGEAFGEGTKGYPGAPDGISSGGYGFVRAAPGDSKIAQRSVVDAG